MRFKKLIIILLFIFSFILLASCDLTLPLSHIEKEKYDNTSTTTIVKTTDDTISSGSTNLSQALVYTVNYYVDEEIIYTDIVVANNKTSKPENPKKSGYNFLGWTTNKYSSTLFDFNTLINDNINLYAKFELEHEYCYITLYVDNEYYDSKVVEYNSTISEPLAPNKDGYTFLYWTLDETLLNKFSFDNPIITNLELYAKYQEGNFDKDSIDRLEVISNSIKTTYNIGEEVDYSGLEVYLVYKNGDRVQITDNLRVEFETDCKNNAGIYPFTFVYTDEFLNEYRQTIFITYQ